ncbi:DUF3788 family protein [Clostridium sp. BNL1100]|uniref:DUF3788 family protein n=1 Tax=Clostridium sp. BNL1100 TaxID=755731 RepID=UPI00024A7AEC|nr:DUF3788 family protein [Clostridium sp. BNL1100]AEY67476.1 hypothetical protein Clo1100_3331 [Clostridium sp. BNL1100]
MSLSFFCDKYVLPSGNEVSGVLEKAVAMWNDVKLYIEKYGLIKEEWKFYSQKVGWCKKILLISNKEERNIIFLYPNINCFTCVLVFGEKAVFAAQKSELPENILDSILSAKQYREGRSFNVEIRTPQDFEVLKKLIDIKIKI